MQGIEKNVALLQKFMPDIQVIKLFCDGDKKFPILEMLEFLKSFSIVLVVFLCSFFRKNKF